MDELDIAVCGYGFDATEAAFCRDVESHVRDRVLDGQLDERRLGLTLQLYLAAERNELAEVLHAGQRFDVEPERAVDDTASGLTRSTGDEKSQVARRGVIHGLWGRLTRRRARR
jgi:hypothetical protein